MVSAACVFSSPFLDPIWLFCLSHWCGPDVRGAAKSPRGSRLSALDCGLSPSAFDRTGRVAWGRRRQARK